MAVATAPPARVTNSRLASALLALAAEEEPGSRPAMEFRAAAWTLRQLDQDLHGRRLPVRSLPDVSSRAADAIFAFLACGSDESVGDQLEAILEREDPAEAKKRDFLSRADVDRILAARGTRNDSAIQDEVVSSIDLRGDVHLHTDRSDGTLGLATLHRLLQARGDRYALLTDHARDCAVAGGLFPGDFRAQRKEIDILNSRADDDFVMFLGAEANIGEDGSLDVIPTRVPELSAVIASIHTELRSPRDQTARLIRAIETPGVAILGHPRGRLYNVRSGIVADWPRVFARAAACGVAIELNGCPERQDLDPRLASLANDAGCLFALSSDAHARRHLDSIKFALALARFVSIPKDRVINSFSTERFRDFLERCRAR